MERFPTFISWKVKGYEILSALKASGPLRVKGISPASMQKQTLRPLLIVKNSLSWHEPLKLEPHEPLGNTETK